MREKGLAGADAEPAQLGGEGVARDEWAGGRGCGHGWGVSRKHSGHATGLIDQRSFPQVRLGMPK
ncbi:hypothetical protein GCM10027072_37200 [Streptomyces bullii]